VPTLQIYAGTHSKQVGHTLHDDQIILSIRSYCLPGQPRLGQPWAVLGKGAAISSQILNLCVSNQQVIEKLLLTCGLPLDPVIFWQRLELTQETQTGTVEFTKVPDRGSASSVLYCKQTRYSQEGCDEV
jgi:hypothetical protein